MMRWLNILLWVLSWREAVNREEVARAKHREYMRRQSISDSQAAMQAGE